MDDWHTVRDDRNRRRRRRNRQSGSTTDCGEFEDKVRLLKTIKSYYVTDLVEDLVEEVLPFFQDKELIEVAIYGIGSIISSSDSRRQLSFILRLLDRLGFTGNPWIYDPVLTTEEYQFLEENFGMKTEKLTCGPGKRNTTLVWPHPSLLFMPHVEKGMFNDVLFANWILETSGRKFSHLNNITMIGNSFQSMRDSIPERIFKVEYKHLFHAMELGIVNETELKSISKDDTTFNDFSVVTFDTNSKLDLMNNAIPFSLSNLEPVYSMEREEGKVEQENILQEQD